MANTSAVDRPASTGRHVSAPITDLTVDRTISAAEHLTHRFRDR
jgi:hypothetical protein